MLPFLQGWRVLPGLSLSVHLEGSPSPATRLLGSPGVSASTGSNGSHNNVIAKKILLKAKGIGFSFAKYDGWEESRLVALEDKDCVWTVHKESDNLFR
ncbi:hypothetical protein A2U01_0054269 [Trifolium medium]|uniref:Uncharacterized protein n=1 Tax=Trifolium medium TaxID=97028 RepID=A0A392R8Y0_9FABA|nr:hypothetical protein [Trifolium medium]